MRIFLGLDDTCFYYSQLQHGFNQLGISCTLVNAFPNSSYTSNKNNGFIEKTVEWIGKKTNSFERGSFDRYCWIGIKALSLLALLVFSLPRYDVYIFSGGTTFLNSYDLWLLKLLKKRVIVVFHGSDSRPPYINPVIVGNDDNLTAESYVSETKRIKKKIKKIERYADIIIDNPSASHLHEKKIINWHCVGVPSDFQNSPSRNHGKNSSNYGRCVIVHAPTRPVAKGTHEIESAINALRGKGYSIEFIKLVGKTHKEVLEAISTCDFVVDELFSDVMMAAFATEAAAYGKPAIVGMYDYEKIRSAIPDQSMIPPILPCAPDEIEPAIERLIAEKEFRISLGGRAKRFVNEQWDSKAVAKRFIKLANDEIPVDWWFDPTEITRLHGWGVRENDLKDVLRTILKFYGISALQLSDKPALEQAFVELAKDIQNPC